jgi:hypothetical protein
VLLRKALYGLRDANQAFELLVSFLQKELGFKGGLMSPCLYHHVSKRILVYVHGDDFAILATELEGKWMEDQLAKSLIMKCRGTLGPYKHHLHEIRVLNRLVTWNRQKDQIEWEADPRHLEVLRTQLGFKKDSKTVVTPGEKGKFCPIEGESLETDLAVLFRSAAMRCSFLAQDRPEIQFASKECARAMATPTVNALSALKRIARFGLGADRIVWIYRRQEMPEILDAFSDSDHAGCKVTGRSTTMSILMHGSHCIKTSSTTQVPIALSTAESEFHGGVKTASMLLGFRSMALDFGIAYRKVRLHFDASAAKGIASRRGVGRIKHLRTETLWLQQAVTTRDLEVCKIDGEVNPADLGTKHLAATRLWNLMQLISIHRRTGRSKLALQASTDAALS